MERKKLLTRQILAREADRCFEGWEGMLLRMRTSTSEGREEREAGGKGGRFRGGETE